ncbi:phospholipid/cholesterol/gamma-HCH transport system permease protein [Thermodesulfovibrio aggregans]|uniref:Phospholipid/cholesterol/gamma-HCH transport system permease protein n=1 Tax=Thermodesulfovibrio aggregans TaxID=86166 RepID=A0A0U9HNL6_9BACT|nr:ABC transporter permease [Thermodesulfovibrio aggregans]GAQ94686.1 phospholipid/cholesterol/gamma-HCH transport system permease protein [Thermodesulfovibrio aggregans]
MSPVGEVLLRQIYFTGIQALPAITISGLLIGFVIVLQTASIAGAGSSNVIGKILLWLVLKEIGPFFTGLIILTRSGSAIATELATMKLNREIEYLEAMGIKPEVYLLKPRLYGVLISAIVLSIYFQLSAIFGGIFLATLISNIPFSDYADVIILNLSFKEIAMSFSKSMIFGISISVICIWQGLSVAKSSTEIPQRATKAITGSLFSIFLFDVFIDFVGKFIE